ncbi:MAG: cyclase family protein [Pyrinomonadaceae bacterium]
MTNNRFDQLTNPIDISIPLRFNGPQPNAFGVEPAISKACEYGSLIGDTRRGGSVNFEQYTLIPHCNGTHTECVGHLTNDRISLLDCIEDVFLPATVISVEPEFRLDDLVISENGLRKAKTALEINDAGSALIVRTLPNSLNKLTQVYDADYIPPYFTQEAMKLIVAAGFKHLLVDLPSIDRLFDDGRLANHRIFWNLDGDEVNERTRINSTITEMIYVPTEIPDGEYLLNLQIAPFVADAAPSRPLLFRNSAN